MPRKTRKPKDETAVVRHLVERIVRECPDRRPTSEDELKAQMIMKEEFEKLGLGTETEPFKFNESLYANIALHFGLGAVGSVVSGLVPLAGLGLHLLAGGSYWAESTKRAYILRRLLPYKPSQNVLATMPAEGEPALRIVFLAHADAAFTGLLFEPDFVSRFSGNLPPQLMFMRRAMALATNSQFALAGFDFLRVLFGPLTWPLRPLEAVLTIPSLIALALNLQIVIKNKIVPGANDDLSGVAGLLILASRLAASKPRNVEYVFAVTGCEEASLGGGNALAVSKEGVWDKNRTVIIGLDGLGNGDLHYLEIEGEVVRAPIPNWLRDTLREVAKSEPRFNEVKGFEIPVGGTDVQAFLARGWDGVCMVCVDPKIGAPRHYHMPSDTPENLEIDKVLHSIDFTEKLTYAVIEKKLGKKAAGWAA